MADGVAIAEVPNREDHRPDDKNADHVCGERIQGFHLSLPQSIKTVKLFSPSMTHLAPQK